MNLIALPQEQAEPAEQDKPYVQWTSSIYQYTAEAAASAGFTVGSVKVGSDFRLLVMEVARSRMEHAETGSFVKWGYGYRLLVEVSNIEATTSLTLPAIAASVELKQAEATVRLDVNGYNGDDLWELLPVPKPLTIDTYKDFLTAAEKVQRAFAKNPGNVVPVKLAEGTMSALAQGGVDANELRESLAIVVLLQGVREGLPRGDARIRLQRIGLDDSVIDQLADTIYGDFGARLDGHPSDRGRERASQLLATMRADG